MGGLRQRWLGLSGNVQGASWLLLSALSFSVMNALIKQLGDAFHPFELVFFRGLFGLLTMLPFVLRQGRAGVAVTRPWMHVLRAAIGLGSMVCIFTALTRLPLADAVALFFAKPLFMIVLAALFLGERVRWRRSVATAVGFAGVLIMLRPGQGTLEPALLYALAAALLMAVVMVVVKKMTASERPLNTVFWFTLLTTLGALAPALWVWRTPDAGELALLGMMGAVGNLGQYFAVRAYRVGEATAVTPMDYAQLPLSGVLGYLWFAELPDAWTLAGAAVVAGSSLYIVQREARLASRRAI